MTDLIPVKDGTPVLENQVSTENIRKKAKEKLRRKSSLLLASPW